MSEDLEKDDVCLTCGEFLDEEGYCMFCDYEEIMDDMDDEDAYKNLDNTND